MMKNFEFAQFYLFVKFLFKIWQKLYLKCHFPFYCKKHYESKSNTKK